MKSAYASVLAFAMALSLCLANNRTAAGHAPDKPGDQSASFTGSSQLPQVSHDGLQLGDTSGIAGGVPGPCGTISLTQSTDPVSIDVFNSVACLDDTTLVTYMNGVARSFPIPPGPSFIVNCVDFGVQANTGIDFTVFVNIYTGAVTGPFSGLTLLGSLPVSIPAGTSGAVFTADFLGAGSPVTVPGGSDMVVEVLAPSRHPTDGGDGTGGFWVGSNPNGQTAPSYIRATVCGADDFVDLATIGFPDMHVVMRVDGGLQSWTAVQVTNNTGEYAADLHLTFTGGGGTLFVPPGSVVAPGCPAPAIPSNGVFTDTVIIDWGAACVPPGATVTVMIQSPSGPLVFAGGVWTGPGGVIIGPVDQARLTLIGFNVPGGPFWAIKIRTRYTPIGGVIIYSPWFKPPGECWQRWCCFPLGLCCEYRIFMYWFPSRLARFFEYWFGVLPPWCFPLTPWVKWAIIPPNGFGGPWIKQETTIPPPPWEPQDPPGGPPRNPPGLNLVDQHNIMNIALEVRNGEEDGKGDLNFTPSADFASSFFDVFHELRMEGNDPALPNQATFQELLQLMSAGYFRAANALNPLKNEMDQVLIHDPFPPLQQMRIDIEILQLSLVSIGQQMAAGNPNNPGPYFQAANALTNLATGVSNLPNGGPRFERAATHLIRMAEGMNTSGQMVAAGLINLQQRGFYIWGQVGRFIPLTEHFADSMLPHIAIELVPLHLQSWGPDVIGQVLTVTRNADTGETLAVDFLRMNDLGQIQTHYEYDSLSRLVLVKPPTHLSGHVFVPPADGGEGAAGGGIVFGPVPLVAGDANGDNCVDDIDLAMVTADQGMGGEFAEVVPPTDVNHDGIVDADDLAIVMANQGLCGVPIFDCNMNGKEDANDIATGTSQDANANGIPDECEERPCEGDIDGNGFVNVDDLLAVINSWGPCPGCPADTDGNDVVNVDDLLNVINGWGPCD